MTSDCLHKNCTTQIDQTEWIFPLTPPLSSLQPFFPPHSLSAFVGFIFFYPVSLPSFCRSVFWVSFSVWKFNPHCWPADLLTCFHPVVILACSSHSLPEQQKQVSCWTKHTHTCWVLSRHYFIYIHWVTSLLGMWTINQPCNTFVLYL